MNCKNCGNEIAEGMKFCRFCGTAVEPAVQPTTESITAGVYTTPIDNVGYASAQPAPTKKKRKWLIPVIVIVVALCIAAGIIVPRLINNAKHKSPEAVVEAFFEYLKDGKVKKALKCYHSDMDLEYNSTGADAMIEIYKNVSISIDDVYYCDADDKAEIREEYGKVFENIAEVECSLSYMGMSVSESFTVVKDNGKWYMYDFSVLDDWDDYDDWEDYEDWEDYDDWDF